MYVHVWQHVKTESGFLYLYHTVTLLRSKGSCTCAHTHTHIRTCTHKDTQTRPITALTLKSSVVPVARGVITELHLLWTALLWQSLQIHVWNLKTKTTLCWNALLSHLCSQSLIEHLWYFSLGYTLPVWCDVSIAVIQGVFLTSDSKNTFFVSL